MCIEKRVQKSSYLSSWGPVSEAKPPVVVDAIGWGSPRCCGKPRDLVWKSCCLVMSLRASMRANGMTFNPRWIPDSAETVDLGGMERNVVDPHKVEVGVETTAVTATKELSVLLLLPGWPCWAEKMAETCTLISPVSPETEHPPPVLEAPESESWTEVGGCCGHLQTCPPLEFPKTGKWQSRNLDSTVRISWFGLDRRSAIITFKQPGMCLALRTMSWACSHIKRSTAKPGDPRALKPSGVGLKLPPWAPNNWY